VCPIYPSKDFRLVNPTNSNKAEADFQQSLKKKTMPSGSGTQKNAPVSS